MGDQDILLSHNMGQDEPVAPMAAPLKINIQTLEEEETQNPPEAPGLASSTVKETLELAECMAPSSEESHAPVPFLDADPVLDTIIASGPTQEKCSGQGSEPAVVEQPEQKPLDEPELQSNHTEPIPKAKTSTSNPPSLKVNTSTDIHLLVNEEQELPIPKGIYNFDPDQVDDSFNPFTSGGSKIPNSPPPCGPSSIPRLEPLGESLPVSEDSYTAPNEREVKESSSNPKAMMLEFGLDEGTVTKPPPRKLGGKKTISKLATKKQKPKISEATSKPAPEPIVAETGSQIESVSQPESEQVSDPVPETVSPGLDFTAPLNLDEVPIPKTGTNNFDPSKWDDPNFNPFGSNNKMSGSPVLPNSSYSFDPDNFDDSVDPFKPSKTLSTEDSSSGTPQPEKKVADSGHQKAGIPSGEKKVRQIPKKSKEKTAV